MGTSAVLAKPGHTPAEGERPLGAVLDQLARKFDVELIYDPTLVAGRKAGRGSGSTARQTLERSLVGTGLSYRQVDDRTFAIVQDQAASPLPPEVTVPEILVVGRRSQNIDIVRTPDDIQPYQVVSRRGVRNANPASLDDYFRTRVTANRQGLSLSLLGASPRSQIDLHGLGADQTLVLIDGKRVANVPIYPSLFTQSDVNAIPLEAVERIEILPTSAGGIFGLGAAGGAVNIVLDRNYSGGTISARQGVSDRGDGHEWSVYGRYGLTSAEGRTRVMVSASYAREAGLLVGDRSYSLDARTLRARLTNNSDLFVSDAINIQSLDGLPLRFSRAYGGGTLGSAVTFLPLDAPALTVGGLALLRANAGFQSLVLDPGANGRQSSLVSSATRTSVLASLRQEIGARTEAFVDYLRLDDRGRQIAPLNTDLRYIIAPGSAGNPFSGLIQVTYPDRMPAQTAPERALSERVTGGLIRRLGSGWSAEFDASYARSLLTRSNRAAVLFDTPNVFSGPDVLYQPRANVIRAEVSERSERTMEDANLRVGGPLFRMGGGPATLSMTAEYRREHSAGLQSTTTYQGPPGYPLDPMEEINTPNTQRVLSGFVEARAPITDKRGRAWPLRGLELQLAARIDSYSLSIDPDRRSGSPLNDQPVHNEGTVGAATIGMKVSPVPGLTFRGSYSMAQTPPTPAQLRTLRLSALSYQFVDPRRGGAQSVSSLYKFIYEFAGSENLRPRRARTLSAGMVIEPVNVPNLRLSMDYSRISTSREITEFASGDVQYFLDNESGFAGRVQRAPLTSADIAAGYTGGRITLVDTTFLQKGQSSLQTVDFGLDYSMRAGSGTLSFAGRANWEPHLRRRSDPLAGYYDVVGHNDGPLEWRANGGVEWTGRQWSFGIQGQYLDGYSLTRATPLTDAQTAALQLPSSEYLALLAKEAKVRPQFYLDASLGFETPGRPGLHYRFAVKNVLGRKPPIVASGIPGSDSQFNPIAGPGIASYGDPLGRRFEMSVQTRF